MNKNNIPINQKKSLLFGNSDKRKSKFMQSPIFNNNLTLTKIAYILNLDKD
jgi:hypothetical protein